MVLNFWSNTSWDVIENISFLDVINIYGQEIK